MTDESAQQVSANMTVMDVERVVRISALRMVSTRQRAALVLRFWEDLLVDRGRRFARLLTGHREVQHQPGLGQSARDEHLPNEHLVVVIEASDQRLVQIGIFARMFPLASAASTARL